MSADWTRPIRLHELGRGAIKLSLEPDAAERAKIAGDLGLESLPMLRAEVTVRPWLDGAELSGRFRATSMKPSSRYPSRMRGMNQRASPKGMMRLAARRMVLRSGDLRGGAAATSVMEKR